MEGGREGGREGRRTLTVVRLLVMEGLSEESCHMSCDGQGGQGTGERERKRGRQRRER